VSPQVSSGGPRHIPVMSLKDIVLVVSSSAKSDHSAGGGISGKYEQRWAPWPRLIGAGVRSPKPYPFGGRLSLSPSAPGMLRVRSELCCNSP
jgi:hypothetical protein